MYNLILTNKRASKKGCKISQEIIKLEDDQRKLADESMAFADDDNVPPPREEHAQVMLVSTD